MTQMDRQRSTLVTGGAGFIGSELARQLSLEFERVIVLDNLVNGKRENLAGLTTGNVELIEGDIRDLELMSGLLSQVGVVYHLACLGVRHSIHSPHENHEVNATATLHLLGLARDAGVSRIVYVSSSEVYGTARTVPMTEDHPTYPMTVYGASKLAGECYARAFYQTYELPTVIVRPFNTFGPRCHHEGDSGEVIPKFMLRCMAGMPMIVFGDGSQTRDFTYVSDTARGILQAGLAQDAIGETINLGSGSEISIRRLGEEIARVVGDSQPQIAYDSPRPGDVSRLYADAHKAYRLLGYRPDLSLSDGLACLKDWYLSLGQSPQKLLESEIVRNWEPYSEDLNA